MDDPLARNERPNHDSNIIKHDNTKTNDESKNNQDTQFIKMREMELQTEECNKRILKLTKMIELAYQYQRDLELISLRALPTPSKGK